MSKTPNIGPLAAAASAAACAAAAIAAAASPDAFGTTSSMFYVICKMRCLHYAELSGRINLVNHYKQGTNHATGDYNNTRNRLIHRWNGSLNQLRTGGEADDSVVMQLLKTSFKYLKFTHKRSM
jgi:hypothetical protein